MQLELARFPIRMDRPSFFFNIIYNFTVIALRSSLFCSKGYGVVNDSWRKCHAKQPKLGASHVLEMFLMLMLRIPWGLGRLQEVSMATAQ